MERVELTSDEQQAIRFAMQKIAFLRKEADTIQEAITPVLMLFAKNHDVDVAKYVIMPDASAFIKKEI